MSARASTPRVLWPRFADKRGMAGARKLCAAAFSQPQSNNDESMSFVAEKLELTNEIKSLRKEVERLEVELQDSTVSFEGEVERLGLDPKNKEFSRKDGKDLEAFVQNANQREMMQSSIDELDMQLNFFKTLFSDESLEKISTELNQQKAEHEEVMNQIHTITEQNELLMSFIEGKHITERIHETMELKSLTKNYRAEMKTLKREAREMMNDAKRMMEKDPIDLNKKEIILLNEKLEKIRRKGEIHKRNMSVKAKKDETKQNVVQSMEDAIAKDRIREETTRRNMKRMKETTQFETHNYMPLDSLVSPRPKTGKKGQKHQNQSESLFEITQAKENMLLEEEEDLVVQY